MKITVAICTWNRYELLGRTLSSMTQMRIPRDVQWELIIVNNNCSDDTSMVIERFCSALPLREIHETGQGKSFALNAATREARGDLILWTDDDVLVDQAWLATYARVAKEFPSHAFFGGPIRPLFESEVPGWISAGWPFVKTMFAECDYGPTWCEIDKQRLPFGANLAVRTRVQREYSYNTRLGRVANGHVRGEETEVLHRMLQGGYRGYWISDAVVQHLVSPERLTVEYVRLFYEGIGRAESVWKGDSQRCWWERACRRAALRFRHRLAATKYSIARLRDRPENWVKYLARASYLAGRLSGRANHNTDSPPQYSKTHVEPFRNAA